MSCAGIGAKPRDWITAQFSMFENYTRFAGKRLVPQPGQLFGLNATARYAQWHRERDDELQSEKRKGKTVVRGEHTIDERNLKALCRSLRMPETDVLCEKPDEFSVSFLKSKGVYSVVAKKRRQMQGEAS